MKMWASLAAVAVLLSPAVGRAHIGDNLAQLREVYGATAHRVGNALIFQRNGYSICIYFDGDLSAMEMFTRDGSDKNKTDITPEDVTALLKLEGQGQGWSPMVGHSGKPVWLRADKKLIARLSAGDTQADTVFVVMVNEK
jgi:hypothetical protein